MEKVRYMISDAANIVHVESHVLRYWEDELELNIPRNEMGHRYYTKENIAEFQRIKELKEQGYQLKAIRMIVHNGPIEGLTAEAPIPVGQAPLFLQEPAAAIPQPRRNDRGIGGSGTAGTAIPCSRCGGRTTGKQCWQFLLSDTTIATICCTLTASSAWRDRRGRRYSKQYEWAARIHRTDDGCGKRLLNNEETGAEHQRGGRKNR